MKLTRAVKLHFAALAAIVTMAASSEAVVIDNFTAPQGGDPNDPLTWTLTVNPTVTSDFGSALGASSALLGGERDVFLQHIAGNGLSKVHIGDGELSFDSANGAAATATIVWDGVDGSQAIDYNGLFSGGPGTGVDLTEGGTLNFFKLNIRSADPTSLLTFKIYSGDAGSVSTYTVNPLAALGLTQINYTTVGVDLFVPFALFTGTGNFSNVGAVSLEIAGDTGVDLALSVVSSATPEPSSALAAAGLMAVVGSVLGRRNRREVTGPVAA